MLCHSLRVPASLPSLTSGAARSAEPFEVRAVPSPVALHHIPLHNPLYGGVHREGLVSCCIPPFTRPHRATHMTRAITLNGFGELRPNASL